ncbi:MAG: DEAD/SNF2-like helicase [Terrestrivirus sp.]|uniref:DEAD/SNF2-like helicase n=1 Tax=Terrestrivirus sp. TaxID=2487775 RepID=A0A3G4ZRG7_9VIRU|nr:MAG: DEAD/SNF2-like helicase [Terrestrivirus sp.]
MNNYLKGIEYEKQVKTHLLKSNDQVFLWNEIPINIFIKSKIFENYADKLRFRKNSTDDHGISDTGCDIFYFNKEQNQWLITQCKNYTNTVTLEKLAGFYDFIISTGLNGELYYTSKLSNIITRYDKKQIKFINHPYTNNLDNRIIINKYVKLVPRDYQIEAYNKLKDCKRAILQLPCGMGKTLIAIMWAKQFDVIIIFSPLRQHAEQNLERFKNELDDYDKYVLVDSDGTRDINYLKSLLIYKKIIFSVTYKSVDVIEKLTLFGKVGVVIDEFHNLTYDNIFKKDDIFYKLFGKGNCDISIKGTTIEDYQYECKLGNDYNYLFVSATPRLFNSDEDEDIDNYDITGQIEYKYEFGKAIQEGYICDYDVFVPDITLTKEEQLNDVYQVLNIKEKINVEHDVKTHFLIRCMEENGHSKCICYSKDIEDAKNLMKSFETIKRYHSLDIYKGLIVADTTHKQREKILKEFQETNKKAIIFSVRILDECIDIPACDSVFMTSKQTNKIRMIQRVCRANRKDKNNPNKKSGIYMWTGEYNELTELIANLKEFDNTFTKEKVKICNISDNKKLCVKSRNEYEKEYVSMDKVIVRINKVDTWYEKIEKVKKYINENNCKPSRNSEDIITHKLGTWIDHQNKNYKSRVEIMKYVDTYNKWTELINDYNEYFISNEQQWYNNLEKVKQYINDNKCLPLSNDKKSEIYKLKSWISTQQWNYINVQNIMKSNDMYTKWTEFVNEYDEYMNSNEKVWFKMLNNVKQYINTNKRKPSSKSKDENIKEMGEWILYQQKIYANRLGIMKSTNIYNEWKMFIEQYKEYFKTIEEYWHDQYGKVVKYFNECKNNSYKANKSEFQKLCKWVSLQRSNYEEKKDSMKIQSIYNTWTEFKNKNISLNHGYDKWYCMLNNVKKYIDEYKCRPSINSEDEKIQKMGRWVCLQNENYRKNEYIMECNDVYNEWSKFINQYEEHFKSDEEIWNETLDYVKQYINKNKKRPSTVDINTVKLSAWIFRQLKSYKDRKCIMKNDNIYNKWTEFIEEYSVYFKNMN